MQQNNTGQFVNSLIFYPLIFFINKHDYDDEDVLIISFRQTTHHK